jgi:hypothetical protein
MEKHFSLIFAQMKNCGLSMAVEKPMPRPVAQFLRQAGEHRGVAGVAQVRIVGEFPGITKFPPSGSGTAD